MLIAVAKELSAQSKGALEHHNYLEIGLSIIFGPLEPCCNSIWSCQMLSDFTGFGGEDGEGDWAPQPCFQDLLRDLQDCDIVRHLSLIQLFRYIVKSQGKGFFFPFPIRPISGSILRFLHGVSLCPYSRKNPPALSNSLQRKGPLVCPAWSPLILLSPAQAPDFTNDPRCTVSPLCTSEPVHAQNGEILIGLVGHSAS